ncbi:unannotated protein [freshwater metagenome]|uniref:Unannotated protein n=1 Tax=freshwater metagenome TaxID=449393 RepID=A0A6J6MCX9_9ZZZZ
MDSSPLPDKEIGTSAGRTGCAPSVTSPTAHQESGLAAGTRGSPVSSTARANSANFVTAAACTEGELISSIATCRRRATKPSSEAVKRGRPDLDSASTPSAAMKRLGCGPASVPDAMAVTTTRWRARVHAT